MFERKKFNSAKMLKLVGESVVETTDFREIRTHREVDR